MRQALIVHGGWDGHEPKKAAEIVRDALAARGFAVELSDTLDALKDGEKLRRIHLVVPVWTMGSIRGDQLNPLLEAVRGGTGIGGWHGGMGDAFRQETEYQYMVGGQWVSHPDGGGVTYDVHIVDTVHEITRGMKDFRVTSEQYYMHVDPAVTVLATTFFPASRNHGADCTMPVTWVKRYGKGRVFYTSLGHDARVVAQPEVLEMIVRGLVWAARE